MVADFILDIVGYGTARVVVPLLSLGLVRIDHPIEKSGGFNWFGFRREKGGQVLLCSCTAARLGVLFWAFALAGTLALIA